MAAETAAGVAAEEDGWGVGVAGAGTVTAAEAEATSVAGMASPMAEGWAAVSAVAMAAAASG